MRRALHRKLLSRENYENFILDIDNLAPQLNSFINSQRKRLLTNKQTN
ncbi:MAG: hypothetical protein Q8L26_00670 [Candidatus Omnitrophota bacterium]|nr:hypothetical protein [Candidatus Omnitrophota bacterium]